MDIIWNGFIGVIMGLLTSLSQVVGGSYGIAIIIFTILVRLIFLPLSLKSASSMRDMQVNQARLKPQLDALKKKYGSDRQRMMEEQTKLYKEHNISPTAGLSGCLPMLVQMPIWIGLYSALFNLAGNDEAFKAPFLWLPNLAVSEQFPYILTAFTGISQYAIARMSAQPAADDQQKSMNRIMQFMMPAMMVYFATLVPAGLVLYWAVNNVFQFFQQLFTTGWGELWPAKAKQIPVPANAVVGPSVESKPARKTEVEQRVAREEVRSRARGARNGERGDEVDVIQLPESTALGRDGLRVYTLEPDNDGGADLTADGTSRTMEESIARAKGQLRTKRKKKRA